MARRVTAGSGEADLALHWPGRDHAWAMAGPPLAPDMRPRESWPGLAAGTPGKLFHGANRDMLAWVAAAQPASIDLVYMDPPFAVGQVFSYAPPGSAERRVPAYDDRWRGGRAAYVAEMAPLLPLVARALVPGGFLVVHCDWRTDALWRLLLDELLGESCFRNAIMWRRAPNLGRQAASRQLGRVLDTLLVYARTPDASFPGSPPTRFVQVPVDREGRPRGAQWDEMRGAWFVTAPRGDYTDASLERLASEGRVHRTRTGKVGIKYFLEPDGDGGWGRKQRLDTLWDDEGVRPLRHAPRSEVVGYETQKPEALLARILQWMVPPGGTVMDPFAGSGTTLAVAQRLGLRWLGADSSMVSLHVTIRRLRRQQAAFTVWTRAGITWPSGAGRLAWGDAGATLRDPDDFGPSGIAGWAVGWLDGDGCLELVEVAERSAVAAGLAACLPIPARAAGRRAGLFWTWVGDRFLVPES
ncbi:MAG: site-specific DNA-methyltransferase [Candidatus Sericytochromatia bacterium]|nr:site-specific DNA-methyltransferase [Candidatus Tanganyikabacteria bacterium]